jgi:hypothetical protein
MRNKYEHIGMGQPKHDNIAIINVYCKSNTIANQLSQLFISFNILAVSLKLYYSKLNVQLFVQSIFRTRLTCNIKIVIHVMV